MSINNCSLFRLSHSQIIAFIMHKWSQISTLILLVAAIFISSAPIAKAEMRVCAEGENNAMVAIAYPDDDQWISQGWWEIPSSECINVLDIDLHNRYYYLFGIDVITGDEWSGSYSFCVKEDSFKIKDSGKCINDEYLHVSGIEIDTQGRLSVEIKLQSQ